MGSVIAVDVCMAGPPWPKAYRSWRAVSIFAFMLVIPPLESLLHLAIGIWCRQGRIAANASAVVTWVAAWVNLFADFERKRSQTGMGLVQPRLSIALVCAVAGCAQNVVPESLPTPWAVEIAQYVPEPPSIDKAQSVPDSPPVAQNVMPVPSPHPADKSAIALDCSGLLHGWNNCMLTASNTCGSRGYTILGRSDQNPTQPNEPAFTRTMHIRCNS
jgi:hypothetical protein